MSYALHNPRNPTGAIIHSKCTPLEVFIDFIDLHTMCNIFLYTSRTTWEYDVASTSLPSHDAPAHRAAATTWEYYVASTSLPSPGAATLPTLPPLPPTPRCRCQHRDSAAAATLSPCFLIPCR